MSIMQVICLNCISLYTCTTKLSRKLLCYEDAYLNSNLSISEHLNAIWFCLDNL